MKNNPEKQASQAKQAKNYRYYIDSNTGSELTRKTLVLILAGGEGSRLKGLTQWRAKPAVPFGGKYRIIDFALSNCVNSGLRRADPVQIAFADSSPAARLGFHARRNR